MDLTQLVADLNLVKSTMHQLAEGIRANIDAPDYALDLSSAAEYMGKDRRTIKTWTDQGRYKLAWSDLSGERIYFSVLQEAHAIYYGEKEGRKAS